MATMKGENATFDLRHPTPIDLAVQVKDPQGNPRRRAIVVFTLPGVGASAYFLNGRQTLTVQTDDNGVAVAQLVRPNGTAGDFTVRVNAQFGELRGGTEIHLHNTGVQGGGRHTGRLAILGSVIAGGAVAGWLATRGHNPPALMTPPPPPFTTITVGSATVN
jgi:hypothetical protein